MRTEKITALFLTILLSLTGCQSAGNSSVPESAPPVSEQSGADSPPNNSESPPISQNDWEGEINNGVLVLDDGRGIMLYGSSSGYENGRSYAASVNKYKEQMGANVNVYSMMIPSQVTFYMPEIYFEEGVSDRELPHIDDINDRLNGVISIDVYDALKSHVGEEIYYRTDHHWTQLGAYYAAQSFARTAQTPFDELSEYDKHERSGFLGTLYGTSKENPLMKKAPDTFTWYVPKRTADTTYYNTKCEDAREGSYFKNASELDEDKWDMVYAPDGAITYVNTGLKTGRRLMIVGDSFTWAFAPCLFGSFDDIWIIDLRVCDVSAAQLAKDNGVTDLLFCMSVSCATTDIQEKLEKIM